MAKAFIVGVGSYLPESILTNRDLERMVDTSDEWIRTRTGISERRMAKEGEASSDLAKQASLKALEMAGMKPEDLDLIIVATITPDTNCPSCANWLEAKLGADRAVSFDVTAACSGFIFALDVAWRYIQTGSYKNVLVAATECMTKTVNYKDRESCILWGDGAGAVVLTPNSEDGAEIISTHIFTDGKSGDNLLLPGFGSKYTPFTEEKLKEGLHYLRMIRASDSVRVAVRRFAEACYAALEHNGVALDDVRWIIPHQANLRMLQLLAKRLGVGMDKMFINIEKTGNMSSATIPVALDKAVRSGKVEKGDLILLTAFGGGHTWGSALIRW